MDQGRRPADPASMGSGDSQLDGSPPNVQETQEPGAGATAGVTGAASAPGTAEAAGEGAAAAELEALRADLAALRSELETTSDRHLRLAAEFDNFRKRNERERQENWARAQAELARSLLEVLDDLERVNHHSDVSTVETLLEGVQLVEKKLRNILGAAGLAPIEAENAHFDPNLMEAVAMEPVEDPAQDDVVCDVFQRGYLFRGQLLRPARVRVKKHQ